MKRLLSVLFALTACFSSASAKTIICPTCSQDDFEKAYYTQSAPGDTIVLPAGSATWGNSSRGNQGIIYIITNVTVIGQGDSTVITLDNSGATYANGVIACWAAATFSSFKIIGSTANPVSAFQMSSYYNPATAINFTGGFRLTDITFVGGLGGGYFAYAGSGVDSGVIDHCRLTGGTGSTELIFGRGPTNAWQTNNTMGSANNIFIEDCTFNDVGYVCDANSNARFVVRYNTINGSNKVDAHGLASNSPARGFRNMEVYGNHFTNVSPFSAAIEIRGGTSMIFDNISDNPNGASGAWFFLTEYGYLGDWNNFGVPISSISTGNPTTITTASPHGYSTGWLVQVYCQTGATTPTLQNYYTVTVTGPNTFTIPVNVTAGGSGLSGCVTHRYQTLLDYPITDQIGVGKDPKVAHSEPAYVWHNLKNGAPWTRTVKSVDTGAINVYRSQTGNPSSTFTEDQIVQSNRDFYADAGFDTNTGISRGTTAQMNALNPTVAGYGFWVTDQGSWNSNLPANTSGRLYTWNGSAWALAYTPYAYPHPALLAGMIAPSNAIISILVE